VAVGDFDDDSDLDLAVANLSSGNVSLLGDGSGSFSGPTDFLVGSDPHSVAVGDFDGDSDLDLAVANFFSGNVSVLLNSTNRRPSAADGAYTTDEDTPLTVAAPGCWATTPTPTATR
jgi:predicted nucleotidyltransferase